jgi:nucleoside-diphosphate-sugar epimerase
MKVAITGATGFVGRHVVRVLGAMRNVEIVTASRRSSFSGQLPPSARHVALDIGSDAGVAFERLGRPDILIHLAWEGLPNYKSLHHLEHASDQYRFLKALVDAGLRSMTCTGTCFEYGMQSGELAESAPTNPSNPYGFAKDTLRKQLEFVRAQQPFALNWARLFYMYGEGQPGTSLFSQFMSAAARGDERFKMSGGEQVRDFLPVETIAEHLVALALSGRGIGPVNICSGRPISVRSLVEKWRTEGGWNIALELGHFPYADYEPMAFWGSSALLKNVLRQQEKASES